MPSVVIKSKGGSTLATLKVDSSVRGAQLRGGERKKREQERIATVFFSCAIGFFSAPKALSLESFSSRVCVAKSSSWHRNHHQPVPDFRLCAQHQSSDRTRYGKSKNPSGELSRSLAFCFVSQSNPSTSTSTSSLALSSLSPPSFSSSPFFPTTTTTTNHSLSGNRRRPQGRLRESETQVLPLEAALHPPLATRGTQAHRPRRGSEKALGFRRPRRL